MKIQMIALAGLALGATAARAQEAVNRTVPSAPTGLVEVYNPSGSVRVVGWDTPEIRVTGELGRGTERLEVEGGPENTTIRVVLPRSGHNIGGSDLEIRLPSGKRLVVRSTSADVAVSRVSGDVTVTSVSGELDVEAASPTVRLTTTSGDVRVTGTAGESLEASSVSGDVEVAATAPAISARSVSGDLRVTTGAERITANTVSGDARVGGSRIQVLSFESVSGNLTLEGALQRGATVNVQSHSGDVEVALPAAVSADFQVSSFSGDISTAFGGEVRRTNRYAPGRELRFSTGDGGLVSIKTFSGNVRLRKR